MQTTQKHGSSIVEVIIAIAVVSIVITSVAAVISVSLQNTSRATAKVIGTKYTQEAIEYFRAQRTLMGWESFIAALQNGNASPEYCLASLPYSPVGGLDQVPNRPCSLIEFADVHNLYKRDAEVRLGSVNGQQTVTIAVTTVWPDGAQFARSTATVQLQKSQN